MSRSDKQRGLYNSSSTRVEPAFDAIRQENGWQKFCNLVRSKARGGMQGGDRLPDGLVKLVRSQYGSKKSMGGGEEAIPPHRELLDWLIDHAGTDELKKPGKDAGAERKSLFLNPNERDFFRQKAHDEIAAAVSRDSYPRNWFVMEGATRPDVYIETDRFILLIEGKRTEGHFTRTTTWMKHRDQMVRHMDALYSMSGCPRLPVFGLGQDPNGDIFAYAMDCQAGRILGVMCRRFATLREKLPLKRFVLHACANWREEKAVALIEVLKEEFKDECQGWVDSRGADCLLYSLFNPDFHSDHGGWKRGNGLEKVLKKLGYRGTGLGINYDELVNGWETIEESNARNVKPVAMEVPKRGAGRRQTTSAVGIPNQSQVHTFRREALGRTPCPEGFTNAKDFATVGGAIETWKCHENADIRRLWIPQEIKDIQSLAFKGCPNLEEIVCEECGGGEGLSIGLMTFAACPRLCRVVLPARLCGMGKGAFRDDGALMEFSVPKDHYPIVCENHLFDNCPCPDGKLAQLL